MRQDLRSEKGLQDLAAQVVSAFPSLNPFEQRASLALYRLLARAEPVTSASLAQQLGASQELVERTVADWPEVFYDEQRRVVGYRGLSLATAYSSAHSLTVGQHRLSAWCAWDTLFLPQLLAEDARVESSAPDSHETVRLSVSSGSVVHADPAGAHMSFLLPPNDPVPAENVINSFCHFIYFFPSHAAGEKWVSHHPGTFLLTLPEALEVAHLKNKLQYPDVAIERDR